MELLVFVLVLFAAVSAYFVKKHPTPFCIGLFLEIGWMFFPAYFYDVDNASRQVFAPWIIGQMLPASEWISKFWIVPVWPLAVTAALDHKRYLSLQWHWLDITLVLWCLWPIVQIPFVVRHEPSAFYQTLYLLGVWGAPWLLGRLWFSTPAAQFKLIKATSLVALLYVPVSALEGVYEPFFHELLFGAHPFNYVGAERYIGFRPVGFLEDGNQFGIWACMTALAAVWMARLAVGPRRPLYIAQAIALLMMGFFAQSVGAIILMLVGFVLLLAWPYLNLRAVLIAAVVVFIVAVLFYLSGRSTFTSFLYNTPFGQWILGITRRSFSWRVHVDQTTLSMFKDQLLFGMGQWNWWIEAQIRPWGLPQLIIGHYGVPGLFLSTTCLLAGAIAVIAKAERQLALAPKGAPLVLSIIVLLAMVDALLNSFIYFPLVLIAGSLANEVPTMKKLMSSTEYFFNRAYMRVKRKT